MWDTGVLEIGRSQQSVIGFKAPDSRLKDVKASYYSFPSLFLAPGFPSHPVRRKTCPFPQFFLSGVQAALKGDEALQVEGGPPATAEESRWT